MRSSPDGRECNESRRPLCRQDRLPEPDLERACIVLRPVVSQHRRRARLGAGYCEFIKQRDRRPEYAIGFESGLHTRAGQGVTVSSKTARSPGRSRTASWTRSSPATFWSISHKPQSAPSCQRAPLREAGRPLHRRGAEHQYVPGAYWDFFDHYVALTGIISGGGALELHSRLKTGGALSAYTMSRGRNPAWMLRIYLRPASGWPIFGKSQFW